MLPDPEHNHSQSIYFPSSARSWQGLGKASDICFVAGFISSLSLCAGQACHFSAPLALLLSCPVFHNVEGGHRWQHHVLLGTELLASQYKPPGESICHPNTLGYTPVWYIFLLSPWAIQKTLALFQAPALAFFALLQMSTGMQASSVLALFQASALPWQLLVFWQAFGHTSAVR